METRTAFFSDGSLACNLTRLQNDAKRKHDVTTHTQLLSAYTYVQVRTYDVPVDI